MNYRLSVVRKSKRLARTCTGRLVICKGKADCLKAADLSVVRDSHYPRQDTVLGAIRLGIPTVSA